MLVECMEQQTAQETDPLAQERLRIVMRSMREESMRRASRKRKPNH